MIFPAAAIGLSLLGGAAHGAFHRNSIVFGEALGHLPTTKRQISQTFDDGPNPEATPLILDALAEYGVKATFFILGAHAERFLALYGVALFICDTDGDYAVTNRVFDLLVEIDWKGSFHERAQGRAW